VFLAGLAKAFVFCRMQKDKAFCGLAPVLEKKLFEMIGCVYAERFCVNSGPISNLLSHVLRMTTYL
jgi:hypothetical protein